MAVVETGGRAEPKVPKNVTFVDQEAGWGNLEDDIGGIKDKEFATACFLAMLTIFLVAAVFIFIKIPIWPAVGLTSFIGFMMFMVWLLIVTLRDGYIEKCMLENDRAPK